MNFSRIVKTTGALLGGQGVNLATQLLLPPLFLRYYPVSIYGEWLTLTAVVSYLGTLNFGLQTFANNEVSILQNRGENENARTVQATSFALLLLVVASVSLITIPILFLPISHWLKLQTPGQTVSTAVYLLGLQILVRMIFGFVSGSFLVVGASYRGTNWNNACSFATLIGTALILPLHISFIVIAAQQLCMVVICTLLCALDLRGKAPAAFPQLRYATASRAKEILRPSGYFAMLYSSNFLVYQFPVLILQRVLGPTSVVVFSLTRTIFGMSRQLLALVSWAIAPEIVELYGQSNWARLFRLYELSERLVFALVPVVNFGTFLATPLLLSIWIHKPKLYQPDVCLYMAIISVLMGIKEHKYQFQTSANEHSAMARFLFFSYIAMVGISVPVVSKWGVRGFLFLWLLTELTHVVYVVRQNQHLFQPWARLDLSPVYRLVAITTVASAFCGWFAHANGQPSMPLTAIVSALATFSLAAIAYFSFGLSELRLSVKSRLMGKNAMQLESAPLL